MIEKEDQDPGSFSIMWCIPCLNEQVAIATVVARIKKSCPQSRVVVFDNGSDDRSVEVARSAGAEIRHESRRGKGHVVRKMFRECDADILIMIDGDNTNDVEAWPLLIAPVIDGRADMVIGSRLQDAEDGAFRPFHMIGNRILGGLMRRLFRLPVEDVLSGYRVFSRRAFKSIPVESAGFEVETEITLKAVELKLNAVEIPTRYAKRPVGSQSKLRTIHDGLIIFFAVFRVLKDSKPFTFFGAISIFCFLFAFVSPLVAEMGLIGIAKSAQLSVFGGVAGLLFAMTGIILNSVSQRAKEIMQILVMRE
jgi:glycosyltransferase involved in cell wall biosynthesis